VRVARADAAHVAAQLGDAQVARRGGTSQPRLRLSCRRAVV